MITIKRKKKVNALNFSDGTLIGLDAPLYNVDDKKDLYKSNGILTTRCEVVDGEIIAKTNPTTVLSTPLDLQSGLSVTNADFTEETYYPNAYIKSCGFENIWDEEWEMGRFENGQPISSSNIRSKNYIKIKPNNVYYFLVNNAPSSYAFVYCLYDEDFNFLEQNVSSINGTFEFINPKTKYMKFYTGVVYGTTYNHDIAIYEVHNNQYPTEYIPHGKFYVKTDNNELIDLGTQPLHEGELCHTDSVRYINRARVDLGDLAWYTDTVGRFYTESITNLYIPNFDSRQTHGLICPLYEAKTDSSNLSMFSYKYTGNPIRRIVIYNSDFIEPNDFKQAMKGVVLEYEAETSIAELIHNTPSSLNTITDYYKTVSK